MQKNQEIAPKESLAEERLDNVDSPCRTTVCVGNLTASASHELQNALAVIRESAGLMEDFIVYADEEEPQPSYKAKIIELLHTIQKQVIRGGEIAGGLNGLGHAWEEDGSDLNRVLEEFAILAGRLGRMHGVTVGLEYGETKVRAERAGLGLRVALFDILQACFAHAHGSALTLAPTLHHGKSGVLITIDASTNEADLIDAAPLMAAIERAGVHQLQSHELSTLPHSIQNTASITCATYLYFMPCEG